MNYAASQVTGVIPTKVFTGAQTSALGFFKIGLR